MSMRSAIPLLLLVSLFGCAARVPPPELPSPRTPRPARTEDAPFLRHAEARYQRGLDLYRIGRWSEALRAFDETLAMLEGDSSREEASPALRRSADLLHAKTVYYRDRCTEKFEDVAVPLPEPPPPTATIPDASRRSVDEWVEYFTGRARSTFARWLERAGRYEPMMKEILQEEGLPPDLFYMAMIESGLNPNAYSRAHACGMWQFTAGTGRIYDLHADWWYDERRDPELAGRAAARHMKDLYETFGDWYLALAAYNVGEGRVLREMQRSRSNDYWQLRRLPRETREYVPKFLAARRIALDPGRYDFHILPDPPLRYESIHVDEPTSLEAVAGCAGASLSEIEQMNPAIRRSATPPTRQTVIVRVPEGTAEQVRECFRTIPVEERVAWEEYRVRRGDALSKIANRYDTTVSVLMEMNRLKSSHRIREGQTLLVPRLMRMRVAAASAPPPGAKKGEEEGEGTPKGKAGSGGGERFAYRYPVRRGDTLTGIARAFGVTVDEIRKWNDIGSPRSLRAGDPLTLLLPVTVAENFGLRPEGEERILYTVRHGDTLSTIGERHGVSVRELASWNEISSRSLIHPGDRIVILKKKDL